MRITPTASVAVGIFLAVLVAFGALTAGATATGTAATGAATAGTTGSTSLHSCAADSPDEFGTPEGGDAIGYVAGYWYDQPIVLAPDDGNRSADGGNQSSDAPAEDGSTRGTDAPTGTSLNASDGLSDRELSAVVARTAARVEAVRCGSFASVPAVRVENRSTVRASQRDALRNRSTAVRRYDDARLATALLLGDRRNSTRARIATTSAATLGYYEPATDEIVIVSENATAPRVDEPTLAHELVHALQDQLFDLGRFDANRTDAALAESGLVEGDASLVEYRYRQHCDAGNWGTECLDANAGTTVDSQYYGLELFFFQPYNSGPRYVQSIYDVGGWAAVDTLFRDPPRTTEAVMAGGTIDDVALANASFTEAVVDPDWTRLDPVGEPRADRLGPGTIGATMIAPTFDPEITDPIYGAQRVTNNVDESTLDPLNPYDYSIDAATGWTGGRLEVYQNAEGETATRWRTVWNSEQAAATFREHYVELLELRGASTSRNFVGTFHFAPDKAYSGRFSVRQNGTAVVIAHAPTIEGLRALDHRAAREPLQGSSSSMSGFSASKEAAEDALSGPGAIGAILAVCVVGVVLVAVRLRAVR